MENLVNREAFNFPLFQNVKFCPGRSRRILHAKRVFNSDLVREEYNLDRIPVLRLLNSANSRTYGTTWLLGCTHGSERNRAAGLSVYFELVVFVVALAVGM